MPFYAHTATKPGGSPDDDESKWQLLHVHLKNVAELAAQFAAPFGASEEARLAGLLHDLGKYSANFQRRLRDPAVHGINHWSVGALVARQRRALSAAFAIEGHHTGMPALTADDTNSGLQCLKARLANLQSEKTRIETNGFAETQEHLLDRWQNEKFALPTPVVDSSAALDFATALQTRMIFSCLVDADFLDTEQHFDRAQTDARQAPSLDAERALAQLLAALGAKATDGPVNRLRRRLLDDCLTIAKKPPGLFTLTAPTGSGKTLAALAFGLRHIAHHNASLQSAHPRHLRRVIVVIPYTSIIEQTAQTYRDLFEPLFGPHYVLEHHSAVAPRERKDDAARDAEDERLRRARLAQENWDAPLVVTTSVQFFESLFGHKPSQCRKLHNISRSVVIFDEVQTLPIKLVPSLLSAVNLLTRSYGVTAVFGTATQPAFATAACLIEGGWSPTEISSDPHAMAGALRRTRITRRPDADRLSWPALAAELAAHPRVLCVVNLKRHARDLFRALPPEHRFHLAATMCPAHRQTILRQVRARLQAGEPCRLISTQLIEAGVDVDFPRVYRAAGPLDSIIQSAGRCNREGRMPEPGEVVVFRPEDDALPRGTYQQATALTQAFLAENPDADLHEPATYADYFARLYRITGPDKADADAAFAASAQLDLPAAARACRLVGEDTRSVVVRWGEGERLVEQMRREKHLSRDDWRRVHRFSVNFYQSEFLPSLGRGEIVQPLPDTEFYFWNGHYDDALGVAPPTLNEFNL